MAFVPMREAVRLLGLHPNTIRRYADAGIIPSIRNQAGQRLLDIDAYTRKATPASTVCYCRVSSVKQKDDLDRQVAYLQERYPGAEIVRDIGSGLNFKRKGLGAILERLHQGDKLMLVVAHRDRLARFGSELIEYWLEQNGGRLVVHDDTRLSPSEEITQDILSILTVYSARINGLQRYRKGSRGRSGSTSWQTSGRW